MNLYPKITIRNSLLIILTSCSLFGKQKEEEKLVHLKQKLAIEEALLKDKKSFIEKIKKQIYRTEMTLIESRIDAMEKRVTSFGLLPFSYEKEVSQVFQSERKMLSEILEQDANDLKARVLLDRILRLITSINRTVDTPL